MTNKHFSVDLHVHLFMEQGLPRLFQGSFYSPIQASSWKSRFLSRLNEHTLEQSQIGLLVVALYAHPLLTRTRKESIHKQIDLVEAFVEKNTRWIIAKTPREAWNAYRNGKKILILSLEGTKGVLETEEDMQEFIDKRGIRIVTFMHLTNNAFGGAALLQGIQMIHSPIFWMKSLFMRDYAEGVKINAKGLTKKGESLCKRLIQHHVWIDLSHASDKTQMQLIPILQEAKQPLLYTHRGIRSYTHAERGMTRWQLMEVKKTKGIVGLIPSKDLLLGTGDTYTLFAQEYVDTAHIIGAEATVIGSDLNGPLLGIPQTTMKTQTRIDTQGFWHIGQTKELWKALEKTTNIPPKPLSKTIEYFLKTWEKICL